MEFSTTKKELCSDEIFPEFDWEEPWPQDFDNFISVDLNPGSNSFSVFKVLPNN